jgi:hypothetical protein
MYFASYADISVFSIVINLHLIQTTVTFNNIYRRVAGDDRTGCFSTGITENNTEDILTKRASTALNKRAAFWMQPNNGRLQRNSEVYAYILQIK